MSRIRHCVECPRCHTYYLIGFSPYRNGSYLVEVCAGSGEYILHCCCDGSHQSSIGRWPEVKAYRVSKRAHDRGYGATSEVLPLSHSPQLLKIPDIPSCGNLKPPQFPRANPLSPSASSAVKKHFTQSVLSSQTAPMLFTLQSRLGSRTKRDASKMSRMKLPPIVARSLRSSLSRLTPNTRSLLSNATPWITS